MADTMSLRDLTGDRFSLSSMSAIIVPGLVVDVVCMHKREFRHGDKRRQNMCTVGC